MKSEDVVCSVFGSREEDEGGGVLLWIGDFWIWELAQCHRFEKLL